MTSEYDYCSKVLHGKGRGIYAHKEHGVELVWEKCYFHDSSVGALSFKLCHELSIIVTNLNKPMVTYVHVNASAELT